MPSVVKISVVKNLLIHQYRKRWRLSFVSEEVYLFSSRVCKQSLFRAIKMAPDKKTNLFMEEACDCNRRGYNVPWNTSVSFSPFSQLSASTFHANAPRGACRNFNLTAFRKPAVVT